MSAPERIWIDPAAVSRFGTWVAFDAPDKSDALNPTGYVHPDLIAAADLTAPDEAREALRLLLVAAYENNGLHFSDTADDLIAAYPLFRALPAPEVTIDDAMVWRAVQAFVAIRGPDTDIEDDMRAALRAALGTGGEHE